MLRTLMLALILVSTPAFAQTSKPAPRVYQETVNVLEDFRYYSGVPGSEAPFRYLKPSPYGNCFTHFRLPGERNTNLRSERLNEYDRTTLPQFRFYQKPYQPTEGAAELGENPQ